MIRTEKTSQERKNTLNIKTKTPSESTENQSIDCDPIKTHEYTRKQNIHKYKKENNSFFFSNDSFVVSWSKIVPYECSAAADVFMMLINLISRRASIVFINLTFQEHLD